MSVFYALIRDSDAKFFDLSIVALAKLEAAKQPSRIRPFLAL